MTSFHEREALHPTGRSMPLRALLAFADQGVSSATNFAVVVIVARVLDARSFGNFSLALFLYLLCLGTSRALNTESLLIRFSAANIEVARRAARSAVGATASFALAASTLIAAAGVVITPVRGPLVSLAVVLPGLLVQDSWRYAFFTTRRSGQALVNDLCWAAVQCVLLVLILRSRHVSPTEIILAWGFAGSFAALMGIAQFRHLPDLKGASAWWRTHRDLGPLYVFEFWALRGSAQLVVVLISAIVGLATAGALRGAQAILGPLTILLLGARIVFVSEGRRHDQVVASPLKYAIRASTVLAGVAATWVALLAMMPTDLGRSLLGASWPNVARVLVPLGVAAIGVAAAEGAVSTLRILAAARASLRAQGIAGCANLAAGIAGGLVGGGRGVAVGLAFAAWFGAAVWWFALRQELSGKRNLSRRGPVGREVKRAHFRNRVAEVGVLSVLVLTMGGATAALSPTVSEHLDVVLIIFIAAIALGPVLIRKLRRSFDPFAPVFLSSLAILALFVIRPLYDIYHFRYTFLGNPVRATYTAALAAACCAALFFQIGYHLHIGQRAAARLPAPARLYSPASLILASGAFALVGAAFILLGAHFEGGMTALLVNRQRSVGAVPPIVAQGFLICVASLLILLSVETRLRGLVRLLAVVPAGLILVVALPGGNRRYLLSALLAIGVVVYLRRDARPSLRTVVVAVLLLLYLIVQPVRESRVGGISYPSAVVKGVEHPMRAVDALFTTGDTGMIDIVALEIAALRSHGVPWQHGRELLTQSVLAPIPRGLWSGKPQKMRNLLIARYWSPSGNGRCTAYGLQRGICPTLSFVGEAYSDFGLLTASLYALMFGIASRASYEYLRRYRHNPYVQAAYAAGLWLAFYPWIGGMSVMSYSFVLMVLPVLAAMRFARVPERRRASAQPPAAVQEL